MVLVSVGAEGGRDAPAEAREETSLQSKGRRVSRGPALDRRGRKLPGGWVNGINVDAALGAEGSGVQVLGGEPGRRVAGAAVTVWPRLRVDAHASSEVRPGPLSWDSLGSAAGTLSGQESAGQVSGTLNLTMGKVNFCVLSER